MTRRSAATRLALGVVIALAVSACATDPLESAEYAALAERLDGEQARADAAETGANALRSEVAALKAERDDLGGSLELARSELTGVRDRLSDARSEVAEAEAALEAEVSKPWPAVVKSVFVEGCVAEDDPFLSEEEERFLCTCIVDALEPEVSLEEFLTLSVGLIDPGAVEVDPITGLPPGLDESFFELLAGAGFSCGVELAQPRVDEDRTVVLTRGFDGLSLVGQAREAAGAVSLTRKSPGPAAGAVWTSDEVPVAGGFETQFVFEIDHVSWFTIGDGMAFVIQDVGPDAIGGGASGNGYKGMPSSLAVEFDTTYHDYEGDPRGSVPGDGPPELLTNHVAVHTMGSHANTSHSQARIGSVALRDVRLYDRVAHLGLVRYEPGLLSVFVDDMTVPVLEVDVDLADILGPGDQTAWIGFTAGTEPGFYSDFLIHGWTLDPLG